LLPIGGKGSTYKTKPGRDDSCPGYYFYFKEKNMSYKHPEGWIKRGEKHHFFVDGVSLCRHFYQFTYDNPSEHDGLYNLMDCAECQSKHKHLISERRFKNG